MGDWGPLGEVLADKGSRRDQAGVEELVTHAGNLLKLVRETFPNYTMHDEQHARNVIRLMGKLAAPRIREMTGLEAALLILAAYFHDAGMAYSPVELDDITTEQEFRAFLDGHDEAFLATERNGGVPPAAVVEQYCRSRHADRVQVHLDRCDRSLLQWEGASIVEPLATICRSHNEPAAALHDPRFRTDFLFQADLRFCAILLRLADILDLDDTRAPQVIYDHLRLSRRSSPEEARSDREWTKHLAARGFFFPPDPRPNYTLQFIAEPTSPGVEHDLRTFLLVVTDELLQCRSVADLCHDRWRGIPLPGEIDTSTITGHGYKYGEFRFELDRSAVLELFTGTNLYDNPYTFIRELLQNALDATRARAHLFGHESTGIHVTCWEDGDGYVWVRVDDDGIGMDEEALRKYFLRVGKSYYRSTEFEADLVRRGLADRPFGVISRFGVGVLACFMVGDQVELTSRRHVPAGRSVRGVRLSINRKDDYFVLQESDRPGTSMPSRTGHETAFRREPGTCIAVRINPDRTGIDVSTVLRKVESYVFAPPVPVFANGTAVAQETMRLTGEPAIAGPQISEFDTADLTLAPTEDVIPYVGKVRIVAVPLDLGRTAVSPDVQGQILAYAPLPPSEAGQTKPVSGPALHNDAPSKTLADSVTKTVFSLSCEPEFDGSPHFSLRITQQFREAALEDVYQALWNRGLRVPAYQSMPPMTMEERRRHLDDNPEDLAIVAGKILDDVFKAESTCMMEIPVALLPSPEQALRFVEQNSWWSYNGIALPTSRSSYPRETKLTATTSILFGAIRFSGDLRPDLTVSRSEVRSMPFATHSALHLAVRRALRDSLDGSPWLPVLQEAVGSAALLRVPLSEPGTAATFWADPLVSTSAWNSEEVINTPDGKFSIDRLLAEATLGHAPIVTLPYFPSWRRGTWDFPFHRFLASGLLHYFTDLEWSPPTTPGAVGRMRVVSAARPSHPAGADYFAPLFAVAYEGDASLARSGPYLNSRHPLSAWLLQHAEILSQGFPAPFQQLFELRNVDHVNTALRRVARSRPDLAPPHEAYLREDKEGRWWSR